MKAQPKFRYEKGRLWYTRKSERVFFFYATAVMFIVWILFELFPD